MKTKFQIKIEDLEKIQGGTAEGTIMTNEDGCSCTCHCLEATVTGFQIGMLAAIKTGQLNPKLCHTILSQIF